MFLAKVLREHPTEVRSDLQRFFGIDLDKVSSGQVSAFQAASCIATVPPGSALAAAIDPRNTWGHEAHLLHAVLCALAGKELPYPWEKAISGLDNESMDVSEFLEWYYGTKWKDEEWQAIQ